MSAAEQGYPQSSNELLDAFRVHYTRFEHAVHEVLQNYTDSTVLARLGDDLDEFGALANEVSLRKYNVF